MIASTTSCVSYVVAVVVYWYMLCRSNNSRNSFRYSPSFKFLPFLPSFMLFVLNSSSSLYYSIIKKYNNITKKKVKLVY